MVNPPKKRPRGLAAKLMAVEPEYRHAVYKKVTSGRRGNTAGKGSPILPGSFENGKRR